jgi:hypothetical protein
LPCDAIQDGEILYDRVCRKHGGDGDPVDDCNWCWGLTDGIKIEP